MVGWLAITLNFYAALSSAVSGLWRRGRNSNIGGKGLVADLLEHDYS